MFNTHLIGILRTKPETSIENVIKTFDMAFGEGISHIEITSNSENWQLIVRKCLEKGIFIGVGSIKNSDLANEAIKSGAKFLVSPGFFEDVVEVAKKNNIPVFAGVYLEEEIKKAILYDLNFVKFFPAVSETDEEFFKAIKEPFRDEFEELEKKGWKLVVGSLQKNIKENYVISSPTQFYKLYKKIKNEKPSGSILIKLPEGKIGLERLMECSNVLSKSDIKTFAVGGINLKNLNEAISKYNAYGVCVGGDVFNSKAILEGDFIKIESDIKKYSQIIKNFFVSI